MQHSECCNKWIQNGFILLRKHKSSLRSQYINPFRMLYLAVVCQTRETIFCDSTHEVVKLATRALGRPYMWHNFQRKPSQQFGGNPFQGLRVQWSTTRRNQTIANVEPICNLLEPSATACNPIHQQASIRCPQADKPVCKLPQLSTTRNPHPPLCIHNPPPTVPHTSRANLICAAAVYSKYAKATHTRISNYS